jgi:pterin-4a-carbinolamine dehydratase
MIATSAEIEDAIAQGWRIEGEALRRQLSFRDYDEALTFVDRLSETVVDYFRRPDVSIKSNSVQLSVANLHRAGFTQAELRLVRKASAAIDQFYAG